MTSVNTNVAAITALRTLQQTNNQLDATQGRISTGLKIGEAKDNAAYWAISTTLKSDNKSLGTVKDALGLGSATVDVAYQGLNKAKDVLDEIKSKLTAATQAGVDKNVIQSEISELQKQLVSIAGSSVFSGENWLSVDSSATDYDATKKIVASFSRDSNNSVSIGTVDIDTVSVALFDANVDATKSGILDKAVGLVGKNGRDLTVGGAAQSGNTVAGGLTDGTQTGVAAVAAKSVFSGSFVSTVIDANDTITLSYKADGAAVATDITINAANASGTGIATAGTIASIDELVTTVNNALSAASKTDVMAVKTTDGKFALQRSVAGLGRTVEVTAWTGADATFTNATTLAGAAGVTGATPATNATATLTAPSAYASITLGDADDGITYTIADSLPAGNATVTLTRADAIAAGYSDGVLDNTTKFAGALNQALLRTGLNTRFTASMTSATVVTLTAAAVNNGQTLSINNGTAVDTDNAAQNEAGLTRSTLVVNGTAATSAAVTSGTAFPASGVTLDDNDKLYFDVTKDGAASATAITIDKATVNAALKDAKAASVTMGTFDATALGSGTTITVNLSVNGGAAAATTITGLTSSSTVGDFAAALNAKASFATTANLVATVDSGRLVISSKATGAAKTVQVTSVSADNGHIGGLGGLRASTVAQGSDALADAGGTIATTKDMATVVQYALDKAKVSGVKVAYSGANLTYESMTAGATSKVAISNASASAGASEMSVDKIDISSTGLAGLTSGQVSDVLSAYISVVNTAINKVTTAAANLGAASSRIEMQKSFVNTLMDTIDKGVGGLVDADMSEESTKLQALQVKQSLGVQALSIANQSSQNILRLFQ